MIGRKVGKLTVTGPAPRGSKGRLMWQCACECGGSSVRYSSQLSGERTRGSCCAACVSAKIGDRNKSHGFAACTKRPPEYIAWKAMRRRCMVKPGHPDYQYYAARGITVCDRWNDFLAFYEDMGPKPSPSHSLDRINGDGDYEPGNCRWATATEQSQNRRYVTDKRASA